MTIIVESTPKYIPPLRLAPATMPLTRSLPETPADEESPILRTTDPVTREIIKNALMSAADTMALTVVRTARSAVIKHGMDFSTALFNTEGLQVAQGLTLPPYLGSMAPALEGVMNAFGDEVFVDFDGTSPQAKGSINPNFAYTKSNVYAALKAAPAAALPIGAA